MKNSESKNSPLFQGSLGLPYTIENLLESYLRSNRIRCLRGQYLDLCPISLNELDEDTWIDLIRVEQKLVEAAELDDEYMSLFCRHTIINPSGYTCICQRQRHHNGPHGNFNRIWT